MSRVIHRHLLPPEKLAVHRVNTADRVYSIDFHSEKGAEGKRIPRPVEGAPVCS